MIGNDIVDLAQARQDSNWQRRGYLDKLFTDHEQQLILSAPNPDRMVWLLWSMKESVYKVNVRQTGHRTFAPRKIVCQLSESTSETATGDVFYHETYRTESVITAQYISTVAFAAHTTPHYTQVIVPFATTDYQTHQDQIRERIRQYSARLFAMPEQTILISKDHLGAPLLTVGSYVPIPLSISHHGLYGAFAMEPALLSCMAVV